MLKDGLPTAVEIKVNVFDPDNDQITAKLEITLPNESIIVKKYSGIGTIYETYNLLIINPGNYAINLTASDGIHTIFRKLSITAIKSIIDYYDKNHDSRISTDELINAFDDWIEGEITTDQFIEVFDAWMSS